MHPRTLFLTLFLLTGPSLAGLSVACATEVLVAAASNFTPAITALAQAFERRSGHRIVLSFGSTGRQYAQITRGAPYDLFFAADAHRPQRLEQAGIAIRGSRFTYAHGRIALWSAQPDLVNSSSAVLANGDYRHLAIANPRLAPYGAAAKQLLQRLDLWPRLQPRLVRGENIAQTYQFVATGNAQLGIVALSQLVGPQRAIEGSHWLVPDAYHDPIEQQAVRLSDNPVGQQFLAYVRSDEGRAMIAEYGYVLP